MTGPYMYEGSGFKATAAHQYGAFPFLTGLKFVSSMLIHKACSQNEGAKRKGRHSDMHAAEKFGKNHQEVAKWLSGSSNSSQSSSSTLLKTCSTISSVLALSMKAATAGKKL
ncbi:hypothetical protein RJ639_009086 [Escallonia herrerae]|uniref:Uncharacterized protein n=1 Tax=Escallonia herrerae TaxID=1293975 RepID=A0AA89ATB6_9ASTE|nr:hypothetical protein RJ639_009086 [Escallonia herrerae]